MDSMKLLEKFKELRYQFIRNFEQRKECQRDRTEVVRQRTTAVREKWLLCVEEKPFQTHEERDLATALIQETIDLCDEHIKGLDVDLNRLDMERTELLEQQENLKQHLSMITKTSTSENSSSGLQTSAKVGRKYELQRKIDIELQKLYTRMEAEGTLDKHEDEGAAGVLKNTTSHHEHVTVQHDADDTDQQLITSSDKTATMEQHASNGHALNPEIDQLNTNGSVETNESVQESQPNKNSQVKEIAKNESKSKNVESTEKSHNDSSERTPTPEIVVTEPIDTAQESAENSGTTSLDSNNEELKEDKNPTESNQVSNIIINKISDSHQNNNEEMNSDDNVQISDVNEEVGEYLVGIEPTATAEKEVVATVDCELKQELGLTVKVNDQKQLDTENIAVVQSQETDEPSNQGDIKKAEENRDENPQVQTVAEGEISNTNEDMANKATEAMKEQSEEAEIKKDLAQRQVEEEVSPNELVESKVTEKTSEQITGALEETSSTNAEVRFADMKQDQTDALPQQQKTNDKLIATECNYTNHEQNNPETPILAETFINDVITADDVAENMKNRTETSQQSTPSYQNLVGDVDEEVIQDTVEIVEEEKEASSDSISSSDSESSSASEEEDFSGNDIDIDMPESLNENIEQSCLARDDTNENLSDLQISEDAKQVDFAVQYEEEGTDERWRLANEIVEEVLSSAVAYLDAQARGEFSHETDTNERDNGVESDKSDKAADVHSFEAESPSSVNAIVNSEHEAAIKTETEFVLKKSDTEVIESGKADESEIGVNAETNDINESDTKTKSTAVESIENTEPVEEVQTESNDQLSEESRSMRDQTEDMQTKVPLKAKRPTYNPALSQRNTEAEKWFGQPTSEDKIWMRQKGKLDANAEMERKKLIKSMTRRHNPKIISKWQPPTEKNWEEDLKGPSKESLEKYKQRRQNRISLSHETQATAAEEVVQAEPQEKLEQDPTQNSQTPQVDPDAIVIESVVHSRDAISRWETILHEKSEKEEIERKHLSAGKEQKTPRPYEMNRNRRESESSVSSTTSSNAPPSENIVRESMNVSQIRNRWKNIEEDANKTKSKPNIRRQSTGTNRTHTFTVNPGNMYRPYIHPSPAKDTKSNHSAPVPVNKVRKSKGPIPGESFIDREIREAAEREEEYKKELQMKSPEKQTSNLKAVNESPVVVTVAATKHDDRTSADIQHSIEDDADKENEWKKDHDKFIHPTKSEESKQTEVDAESLSSYTSSGAGNDVPLSPSIRNQSGRGRSSSDVQKYEASDSGIDCNHPSSPEPKIVVEEPVKVVVRQKSAAQITEEMLKTLQEEPEQQNAPPPAQNARSRTSLSSLQSVTPKGWGQKTAGSPISPISPGHKKVFAPNFQTKNTNGVVPNDNVTSPKKTQHNINNSNNLYDDDHWDGALRKTNVNESRRVKSGPSFEIISGKGNVQSKLQQEIEESKKREEEWLRKQQQNEQTEGNKSVAENIASNNHQKHSYKACQSTESTETT